MEKQVKYAFREGSHYPQKRAQIIGATIAHIAHGRSVTPEAVVKAAEKSSSPMHDLFEWDDAKAANAHRRETARKLIQAVVEIPEGEDETQVIPRRAFVSIETEDGEHMFVPMVRVLSDEDMRSQMLADALRDLKALQRKYSELKELASVFDAMEVVVNGATKVQASLTAEEEGTRQPESSLAAQAHEGSAQASKASAARVG